MRLLTFLGTGKYSKVPYQLGDRTWQAHLCAGALVHMLPSVDEVVVFTTPEAKEKWYRTLRDEIGDAAPCRAVDITVPTDEKQVWNLFTVVCAEMEHGEVALDVTHAFRALPIVGIVAAAFIRTTRPDALKGVYYGAYEAKHENGPAPIWDLSGLVAIMEWTSAADLFRQTGNAGGLAHLLRQAHTAAWRSGPSDTAPRQLQRLANQMDELTLAVQACRPRQVGKPARDFQTAVEAAVTEIAHHAPAFDRVRKLVLADAQHFAGEQEPVDAEGALDFQAAMIEWYAGHKYPLHAFALGREWLVTLVCVARGHDWQNPDAREAAEDALNEARKHPSATSAGLMPREVRDCWSWVSDTRNDLLHCGLRKNPLEPEHFYERAMKLPDRLKQARDALQPKPEEHNT